MTVDFSDKSTGQLENFVQNYRAAGKTDSEYFSDLLRALELRRSKGLDLQKTLEHILAKAKQKQFVSYKEVADVNDLEWNKIHWEVRSHLFALCEYTYSKKLPLLSAIVVNVDGVETGTMKPESRAGFIDAAKRLGIAIGDEETFVKEEQARVFAWASGGGRP